MFDPNSQDRLTQYFLEEEKKQKTIPTKHDVGVFTK